MRDALLDRNNTYLAARQRAGHAAWKEVEGLAGAEAIVSDLARWCRDVLFDTYSTSTRNESHGLSDLLAFTSTQSPLRVLRCVSDAKQRQSLEEAFVALMEGGEDERANGVAWLLGSALAKGVVDALSVEKHPAGHLLAQLRNLVESQDVVYFAFEASLRERLADAPLARAAVLSGLESWISDINRDPGLGTFPIEREPLNALVDEWCSQPSIDKLWRERESPLPVHYRVLDLVPTVLPVERGAVLERLDGFRFPYPIHQVLQDHAILHDRDEIVAALEAAPACTDDGRSWNGKLVALLMLRTTEAHCHALWEAAHRAADFDEVDSDVSERTRAVLSSWVEELGRIVMARSDGRFLGAHWLFMKFADERRERGRHPLAGGRHDGLLRQVDLIGWIALGLSRAGLTAEGISDFADLPDLAATEELAPARSASCDDDRDHSRLAALSAMGLIGRMTGSESTDEGWELLGRLDALLASRDSGFEAEADPGGGAHGLPASVFGYLLAARDAPAERWRRSWDLLVEQRRRAQHWSSTGDGEALAPTLFLLATGTAGIDWLLSPSRDRTDAGEAKREMARKLWRELFDGVRDCWLTIPSRPLVEDIETHIGRLFARHSMVFGARAGEGDASESAATDNGIYGDLLARDLELLGGNDRMLAICCINARRNGATPSAIGEALKRNSGYLDTILRQFDRWQGLERKARRQPELVEALTRLRLEVTRVARG